MRTIAALAVLAVCLSSQTRVDVSGQARNFSSVIKPQPGTVVACVTENCWSHMDGSWVLYRTAPPAGPGKCTVQGTGVIAIDEYGYLYVCSVPWWNPATNQPMPKSASPNEMYWLRSAQPMLLTWTADRPPGMPSAPVVP